MISNEFLSYQGLLERERAERATIENRLREKNKELLELQAKFDAHAAEMNAR